METDSKVPAFIRSATPRNQTGSRKKGIKGRVAGASSRAPRIAMASQQTQLPLSGNDTTSQPALRAFTDSGIPKGSAGYTTLVIIHGLEWHARTYLTPVGTR